MIDFEHMFSLLKRIDTKYRQCCEIINEQIELNENSNDRRINKLIKTYYPNSNFEEIRNIRADFLKKIPNARARDEKWLYAVLRWYLNGNIPKNEINRLNKFLGWLHKNKFYANDAIEISDWSLFRFEDIKYAYDKLFLNTNNINKNNTSNDYNKKQNINGFVIRRIDTEEEASMLGYTLFNKEWCIFDDFEYMDGCNCYIITNNNTYKTAKKMPIKNIVKILNKMGYNEIANEISKCNNIIEISENFEEYFEIANINNGLPPYDEYGLSAFVVLSYDDGIGSVYSRYNIPNMADGNFLTENEISTLIGKDINKVCPYIGET
jgi:hypothetical protein